MKHDWRCGARFAALASLLVLSAISSASSTAQNSDTFSLTGASTTNAVVVSLDYQEVQVGVSTWGISVQPQTAPFAKEPALAGRKVKRGKLDVRPGRSQALGFIWDSQQAKFYLDANGNSDLTDDTNSVFTSQTKSSDERFQSFSSVRLTLQTDQGPYPVLLDLNVNQSSTLHVSASLRSFYSGKVTLANRDWQVGIIEKPYSNPGSLRDASLLLRPWESRTQAFGVDDGQLQAFALPKTLFFDGHSYQVAAAWEAQAEPKRCRLALTEQAAPLGDLKITGEHIRRALLKEPNHTAIFDAPTGTVQVPVGTYTAFQVHLQKGDRGASLKSDFLNRGVTKTITVRAGKPATLAAGGPLTNTVALNRRGSLLVLSHSLVGVGGDAYQLDGGADYQHPPTFAIYRGDKQLATGKFEFG